MEEAGDLDWVGAGEKELSKNKNNNAKADMEGSVRETNAQRHAAGFGCSSRVASELDSNQRKPLAGDYGCVTGGLGFSKQG